MSTLLKTVLAVGLLLVFSGTTQAVVLDSGWSLDNALETNIGEVGVDPITGGTVGGMGSSLSVYGGGSDIGGTSDHGFFVYYEVVGDGSISALVQSFSSGDNPQKKAGLMIRNSLDSDAANVANFALDPFVDAAGQGQNRAVAGADTSIVAAPAGAGENTYLQVTRSGDQVELAWKALEADPWTTYATFDDTLYGSVYVGLAVTAHDNEGPIAQGRFWKTKIDITGFATATDLVWDKLGSDAWDSLSWLGGPPNTPDNTTNLLLEADNSDTVTVGAGGGRALSLTVLGGEVLVANGQTLDVDAIEFAGPDAYLTLRNNSTLRVRGSGEISQMINIAGDVTVNAGGLLEVTNLGAHLFAPGTITKQGAGTLQFDNETGAVVALNTTFIVKDGMLKSAGVAPLGGAQAVVLDGGDLSLTSAGAINMVAAVVVDANAEISVDTVAGAYLGALTLNADLKTSGAGLGLSFTDTSIPIAAVTIDTDIDSGLGVLTAPGTTITKKGPSGLGVLGGGDVTGATFVVEDGMLMGVAMSNPFEGADLVLDGGTLLLANNSGAPAVVDSPVSLTANSALAAGTGGWPFAGPGDVTLGGVNGVDMAGNELRVGTTDGYTLDIAGAFTGGGTIQVTEGTVVLSGESDPFDSLNVTGGALSTTAALTIGTVDVSSGALTNEDVLNVTSVLASGGSLTTAATVNAVDVAVSGSALVDASAAALIMSNSLARGSTTYSIDSSTFEAMSSDMLAGVDLSYGGAVGMTIEAGGAAINETTSNFQLTDTPALSANGPGVAKLGELRLMGGATVTLGGSASEISFANATGEGTIVGDVTLEGVAPGSSVGTLNVDGNLALGDMSVYEWELDGTGGDMINITGNLTGELGWLTSWTFKVKTTEEMPAIKNYVVFHYDGYLQLPLGLNFDVSEAAGWDADNLTMRVGSTDGNVFLAVVPEPSTLLLLLAAGVMGLIGYTRRRSA